MNCHEEKEYKMILNYEQYITIFNTVNQQSYKQINHYYSSNSNDVSIRIREVNNKFIFTLKTKEKDYHNEYEFEIKDNNLNDERISFLFNKFNIINPQYLGDLITYRTDIKLNKGIISLDKNEYLNTFDYEIEYELNNYLDGDEKELIDFLDNYNFKYVSNTKTKRKRFEEKLKENSK